VSVQRSGYGAELAENRVSKSAAVSAHSRKRLSKINFICQFSLNRQNCQVSQPRIAHLIGFNLEKLRSQLATLIPVVKKSVTLGQYLEQKYRG